jgi:hypothetical protein
MHPKLEALPKVSNYQVRTRWMWGSGRWQPFHETYTCSLYIPDGSDLQTELVKVLKDFIVKMARKWCYDGDRLNRPLHPTITSVDVMPAVDVAGLYLDELDLRDFQEREKEWTRQLTEEGKLYIDGKYNHELAPENRETTDVDDRQDP